MITRNVDPTPTVELDVYASAMHIDQPAGYRQAETGSALLTCAAIINLMKLFEYLFLIFRRYARAGVR